MHLHGRPSAAGAAAEGVVRTVGALLLDPGHHVLLGLRARWKDTWPACWDCIGGHVEAGESLEDALAREVEEEIGVRPTCVCLLGTVQERRPELYGEALHHIYLVTAWEGGAPENVSDEHSEIRWFDVDAIAALHNLADRDYRRLIGGGIATAGALRTQQGMECR